VAHLDGWASCGRHTIRGVPEDRPPEAPQQTADMVWVLDGPGLAVVVKARMHELRIKHDDLVELAGIASSTLYEIKSGKGAQEFRPLTLKQLSVALQWSGNTLNGIYRKLVPRNSVLSDPSILETAVAAAIAPELARIRARLDQIETRLAIDPMANSGDFAAPDVNITIHLPEEPGE
jgi:DNA-binding Xre family transcriptional regulator